jgi:6-phosphogluconolactonase (cycloisomerase 2 family)
VGGEVLFTATVGTGQANASGLTGAVAFSEDGKPISACSNMALTNSRTTTCNVSLSTVGANTIVASYSGNATYAPSTSELLEETVSRATTTRLVSLRNPLELGRSVTFIAIVGVGISSTGSPTGAVSFSVDGQSISTCANMVVKNSKASCTVAFSTTGTATIVASYLGSTNYAPSTSGSIEETVSRGLNGWFARAFLW